MAWTLWSLCEGLGEPRFRVRIWIYIQMVNLSIQHYACCKNMGESKGLGFLTLSLPPAENYQIRVSLPPVNDNCFIQSETDSQRNSGRDLSAGWHALLWGSLKSLLLNRKGKREIKAVPWSSELECLFLFLFCFALTMWPDKELVWKLTFMACWGLGLKTVPWFT